MSLKSKKQVKKRSAASEPSLEDYYQNKVFVKPGEKTLETIFEEPRFSKDGAEQLTSAKKLKRWLHCDELPNAQKLRKRRIRAKKYTSSSKFFSLSSVGSDSEMHLEKLISEIDEAVENTLEKHDPEDCARKEPSQDSVGSEAFENGILLCAENSNSPETSGEGKTVV